MIYEAEVISVGDIVEEEVTIKIGRNIITCFASYSPWEFHIGCVYMVDIFFSDVISIVRLSNDFDRKSAIRRIGGTYSYDIIGCIEGNIVFSQGMGFDDEYIGNTISNPGEFYIVRVERLDVEFIEGPLQHRCIDAD